MDLMSGIAEQSMDMKRVQFEQQYAVSLMKKTMDTEEMMSKEILDMLPQIPKGKYVDISV